MQHLTSRSKFRYVALKIDIDNVPDRVENGRVAIEIPVEKD
jgi:hypothetical protein